MHRFFLVLSKGMAYVGGAVLSALVGIVVLSILGRELNGLLHADLFQNNMKGLADWLIGFRIPGIWGDIRIGPFNGDYEIVEAGMAFTIFSFLPLAHIAGAHATVDIFTQRISDRQNRILTVLIDVAFAAVLVIIALQLFQGTLSKFQRGQTTFLLQFPVWWAYALSLVGAVIAAMVSVYLALMRIAEAFTGRHLIPTGAGADH
ncbi:MAG TPA: C4-dicarboxylate ABC transporter permease [Rhodobacteraceae bacterium]|nr:C4-dicarboxylate ABC transporter permease [Paracoccaceae bacterium]